MADTYDPLGIAGDSTPIGTDCGGHAVSQEEETWGENEDLQPVCDNCGTHFCTEVDAGIDLRYMDDLEAQKAEDVQQLEEEEENLPEPNIVELDTPVDTVFINDDDEVVGFESGDAGELEEEEPDTVV